MNLLHRIDRLEAAEWARAAAALTVRTGQPVTVEQARAVVAHLQAQAAPLQAAGLSHAAAVARVVGASEAEVLAEAAAIAELRGAL